MVRQSMCISVVHCVIVDNSVRAGQESTNSMPVYTNNGACALSSISLDIASDVGIHSKKEETMSKPSLARKDDSLMESMKRLRGEVAIE